MKSIAIKAAQEAACIVKKKFLKIQTVGFKGNDRGNLVTQVDLKAEQKAIKIIQRYFPNHNILAEETGEVDKKSPYTWVIDPIDGTSNFVLGIPFFSTIIAVLKNKQPILGVIFDPIHGELFVAQKNQGAFLNKHPIKVSQKEQLDKTVCGFGYGHHKQDLFSVFNQFGPKVGRIRILACTSLTLAYLACGRLDVVLINGPDLQVYDLAAGELIIKEAGGKVAETKKCSLVASNPKLFDQILKILGNH